MTVKVRGREYDYGAECLDCPNAYQVFATREEREAWIIKWHKDHRVETYLQGRV